MGHTNGNHVGEDREVCEEADKSCKCTARALALQP